MSESDGERAGRSLALEQAYVHDVYEQCAERTVQSPHWPRIKEFLEELDPGALVCDVGCGNGKYLDVNHNVFKIGVDRCQKFTSIVREKQSEVLVCDNLMLPFRDDSFDAVLSIAVVHHFSTTERRVRALKELARVLRIGGRLIISAWAMEQKHRKFESQDVLVPWSKAYGVHSCGSSMKSWGMSCNDRHRGKDAQTYLVSKRNSQGMGSNVKNYWIDQIASSSTSTSSLSSPNATCYSFFRRALQKLAGGRRGSRAWFLENWQSGGKERRTNSCEKDDDVEDLPIELRRLEDCTSQDRTNLGENRSAKSKSLSNIFEAQRFDFVRSHSSVPGFGSIGNDEHQCPPQSARSQLLDDPNDLVVTNDPITKFVFTATPNFQMFQNRRNYAVQKQSSMNEELMSIERLKERENTRRNITKQVSLNEELIYKDQKSFEAVKDTIYSNGATKRFQILKKGLTNRIRFSTTNIEKISGMSIKNGLVKILQTWTSMESPITATTWTTANTSNMPKCAKQIERRLSREDGSDSSKDGSLQSDTSVDSEDSFASVIYVPKKSPSFILEKSTLSSNYQLGATSAPPSPRIKYVPELATSHLFKLKPMSPLLKQFPATSKSLPPPSPPGYSLQTLGSPATRTFFSRHKAFVESQQSVPNTIEDLSDINPIINFTAKDDELEISGNDVQNRVFGSHQIKELLHQKPACLRSAYSLVRRPSGSESTDKIIPQLLELELFNPETDDLDSDSSGLSSPDSVNSVVNVIDELDTRQQTASMETSRENMDKKLGCLGKWISPVESTWNDECKQQLIDVTDRLSKNLTKNRKQVYWKTKLELPEKEEKFVKPTSSRFVPDNEQEDQISRPRKLNNRKESGRNPSHGLESGEHSLESTNSSATNESSQPEFSGVHRNSKLRLCSQTCSISEETRPQWQSPNAEVRQQQRPLITNGTLSGSSSQESLPSDRITYHQYYHVFHEGELDQLIGKYVENLHVISSYYDHASWCVVAEKVQVWTI